MEEEKKYIEVIRMKSIRYCTDKSVASSLTHSQRTKFSGEKQKKKQQTTTEATRQFQIYMQYSK